jgi:hypothetical protein
MVSSADFLDQSKYDSKMAAHPTDTTRSLRNHLQATTSYEMMALPPARSTLTEDATEEDPDHIHRATNIIAASDSSVDPITGEATYNWRITTYDKKGLITKSRSSMATLHT